MDQFTGMSVNKYITEKIQCQYSCFSTEVEMNSGFGAILIRRKYYCFALYAHSVGHNDLWVDTQYDSIEIAYDEAFYSSLMWSHAL